MSKLIAEEHLDLEQITHTDSDIFGFADVSKTKNVDRELIADIFRISLAEEKIGKEQIQGTDNAACILNLWRQ
jgi:hypothetical protein